MRKRHVVERVHVYVTSSTACIPGVHNPQSSGPDVIRRTTWNGSSFHATFLALCGTCLQKTQGSRTPGFTR